MSEKLTEGQLAALRWADEPYAVHWAGKVMGSPPRATVKALLRRGLLNRVGHPDMDLHKLTETGRLALAAQEGGETDGSHA
jgi:hypothetical protein